MLMQASMGVLSFLLLFLFLSFPVDFIFYSKMERKAQRFPVYPCPPTIAHQSGTFVTVVDEPTRTRHHPKSRVAIRVHSWCGVCRGLGQTYNDGEAVCPGLTCLSSLPRSGR